MSRNIWVKLEYLEGSRFRTEEPLKGYRQWCLDDLMARAKANGVI